ncbi:L,D-transpeptidase scaffold domain-containing protein [Hymenobacter seoulensis]
MPPFALLWLLLGLPLLLTVPRCGTAPPTPTAEATSLPRDLPAPSPSVAVVIQALLDTTGSTRQNRDHDLGLQAGEQVRTFYGPDYLPAWTEPADSLTPAAQAALGLLARATHFGLSPSYYHWARLQALRDSLRHPLEPWQHARQQAQLEVYLSDAVLRFMSDVIRGRLRPYTVSAGEKAAGHVRQPATELRAALLTGTVPTTMLAGQPNHREYRQLQQALAQWLARPAAPDSAYFQRVQYEHAALNLERWRWNALPPDAEYVLINIPAFALQMIRQDTVRELHRVVVGKPETPTPTLSSRITHFTLAPDWHVPRSIATKELLPKLQEDATYLSRNGMALYNLRGQLLDPTTIAWRSVTKKNFAYEIRQAGGCENALGNIVFRFQNPYAVYLHDTPMRQFFERPDRALSHGCIRLQYPMQLAQYLLRRESRALRLPTEAECARQRLPQTIWLHQPLPIYVRYATCVAENGRLRFLPDVYHRDEAIRRALFAPGPAPAPAVLKADMTKIR